MIRGKTDDVVGSKVIETPDMEFVRGCILGVDVKFLNCWSIFQLG